MKSSRLPIAAVLASLLTITPYVAAGPSIIRDEMLQDTAITPALGRGYSIATNTYQSMCLIDVVSTTPSYDFDYSFEEITQDTTRTGSASKTRGSRNRSSESTMERKGNRAEITQMVKESSSTETTTDGGSKATYQHMLATITVNVYYNSVDETKSKLSPAAVKIMEGKDIPGFFDACGMYYVRSISRRARIYALVTYTTQEGTRDYKLDAAVKTSVRSFSINASSSTAAASVNTMPDGVEMVKSQPYTSPNGKFRMIFHDDGNLCVYEGSGIPNCQASMRKFGAGNTVEFEGSCFGIWYPGKTWFDARNACASYGDAHLAQIDSEVENATLAQLVNTSRWSWIGANDIETEGTFVWANKTPITFNKWGPQQPDNYRGDGDGQQDCSLIEPNGLWNDGGCASFRVPYICEGKPAAVKWCSFTQGRGVRASVKNSDVVIFDSANTPIWSVAKDRVGQDGQTRLVMGDDGVMTLISRDDTIVSRTGTNGSYMPSMSDSSTEDRDNTNMKTVSKGTNLQITAKAVGLGKNKDTMLVFYDVKEFKTAVQNAFKATLPENVGKVSAIEVVPWVENTEFQSLFKMQEVEVKVFDAMGFPVMDQPKDPKDPPVQRVKKVMAYEQKRILQTNAEFLAEVDRAARAKLNVFYKAKMCRAQIEADWMTMDEETGKMYFPVDQDAIANAIEILKASYGANCNPTNVNNMTEVLGEECDDSASCTYNIDLKKLGDPAPGCEKAYEVEYRCMAPAKRKIRNISIAKEANGKDLVIDCANKPGGAEGAAPAPVAMDPFVMEFFNPNANGRPTVGQTNWVWNNRKPKESVLLEEVAIMLADSKLQRLWMEYDSFMYGGTGDDLTGDQMPKDPVTRKTLSQAIVMGNKPELGYPRNLFPGAARCMNDLFTTGITIQPYRAYPNCARIEESFATISGQRIDDYCMPRFTRVPGQESIEEGIDAKTQNSDTTNRARTESNVPTGPDKLTVERRTPDDVKNK